MIEWIPHDSSECPVKAGALVEADYGGAIGTTVADSVDWGSVRRYRVRMPAPDDGWIEWAGGECPVQPDTVVKVEFCDGVVSSAVPAECWLWQRTGGKSDITRYRIVRPPLDFHTTGAPIRADDVQVAGDHYKTMPVQPWAVMASCMPDGFPGFLRGNVLKYAMRAGAKGPALDDARKCAHYAQKWVETLETQSGHERTQAGHA